MSLINLINGGGRRRRSDENWADLERKASDAEARAKRVKGAVLNQCPAHVHGDFWVHTNQPQPCPWCEIVRLREQIQLLVTRPTPRPGAIAIKAPADGAGIAIPATEPTTDVNADTQAVDVADLRAAMGEGDTQLLPVVPVVAIPPLDQLPAVTWGTTTCGQEAVEKWATATSPRDAGPTEVSPITGHLASHKVQLATTSTD